LFRDGELFEGSVGLVTLWLGLHTSDTGLAELLYVSMEARPGVTVAECFVLTKMSSKDVIMIVLENMCAEVISRWYINSVVKEK